MPVLMERRMGIGLIAYGSLTLDSAIKPMKPTSAPASKTCLRARGYPLVHEPALPTTVRGTER